MVESEKLAKFGESDEICPVCLLEDVVLWAAPCGHSACMPCLERIFTIPLSLSAMVSPREDEEIPSADAHLDVPTRGRCPMCRKQVCLFQLVPLNDIPTPTTIIKEQNISRSDLHGRVYKQERNKVGAESIHFPDTRMDPPEEDAASVGEVLLPYIDFSQIGYPLEHADGTKVENHKYFQKGNIYFHERTRTFHGMLKWGESCDKRVCGSLEWEYVLAFSSDYQFISRGHQAYKRQKCNNKNCSLIRCKFPMDGKWQVSWPDGGGRHQESSCIIHNNSVVEPDPFLHQRWSQACWSLHFDSSNRPSIHLLNFGEYKSDINLAEHGIGVGESIMLTNDANDNMVLIRLTDESETEYLTVKTYGNSRPSQLNYHLVSAEADQNEKPTYTQDSLWGNSFCQGFKIGLASYHFMANIDQGAYISYEHELTSMWPPLDNGNPIPTKIWFSEISFDPEARIFRGKIDWEGKQRTPWQGCKWWRYEMHFDEHYTCIQDGYVKSTLSGSNDEMDLSQFGRSLLYINAGLVEQHGTSLDRNNPIDQALERIEERITAARTGSGSIFEMPPLRLLMLLQAARITKISYPRSSSLSMPRRFEDMSEGDEERT